MEEKTHFGFKSIDSSYKKEAVSGVFSSVANKYDLMNDIMSMGIHHLWKDRLVGKINANQDSLLLDVAGGTGDISIRYVKKYHANAIICDYNHEMIKNGKKNAINNGITQGIEWVVGDAEHLPFPDNHFDFYTISFGIRNVTNIHNSLSEAQRILKPGGKFLCMEFSPPEDNFLGKLYDIYSFKLIPFIGGIIANDRESYQYLVESIRKFPSPELFSEYIAQSGFVNIKNEPLTGGIVNIHTGWKC